MKERFARYANRIIESSPRGDIRRYLLILAVIPLSFSFAGLAIGRVDGAAVSLGMATIPAIISARI
jgi:hypothetical protein